MTGNKTKTAGKAGHEGHFLIAASIPQKVREVFLQESRKKLDNLGQILQDHAVEKRKHEIYVLCHGYKGNAGYLGLLSLEAAAAETCRAINRNAGEEELTGLLKHLEKMLRKSLEANEKGVPGANEK